ncbi:hypothetical protein [Mycobacterium tilburgii]|uniref:hypothetical protein n=1 Tax=Mycobacterium tilburgii TaxID=44467 RepID=UPI00389942A5
MSLEHQHVPAGIGEHRRRDQPVVTGTDDDRVDRLPSHGLGDLARLEAFGQRR